MSKEIKIEEKFLENETNFIYIFSSDIIFSKTASLG
jgi:hypothetical protein